MQRREMLKTGACLLCSAVAGVPVGKLLSGADPVNAPVGPGSIRERTFRLQLRPFMTRLQERASFWLSSLLERLGREGTLALWPAMTPEADDPLLHEILRGPWAPGSGGGSLPGPSWPAPVESVSREMASKLLEQVFPLPALRDAFPSLDRSRSITAYHALHLLHHGVARLSERLIDRLGKQGELIAYDVIRMYREQQASRQKTGVAEFLRSFSRIPSEPDIFSAGTSLQVIKTTSTEVLTKVTECEWARYFSDRHPRVGYLVACSTDEASYRAVNSKLRLQRTTTLMEGGDSCDFRVYSI